MSETVEMSAIVTTSASMLADEKRSSADQWQAARKESFNLFFPVPKQGLYAMASQIQEILSLLWISVKQKGTDTSSLDEETCRFFAGTKPLVSPATKKIVRPQQPQTIAQATPKPVPAQVSRPRQPLVQPVPKVEAEAPPESVPEEPPSELLVRKHDKLLPKAFSFVPLDSFQTRKNILAAPNMPRLRDGCLYETPEKKTSTWAFFSFPLPPQEEQFLNSVVQAVGERLQIKVMHFSCLDGTFPSNLTLSALDTEKLFFFIEPHNESTLKRLLEAIPEFSGAPPREVDPFLSLGSIHGNPLHLFFLTPTTTATNDVKSRLWFALKKLALGAKTP